MKTALLSFLALASIGLADPLTVRLWPEASTEPASLQAPPETLVKRKVDDGLRRISNVTEPTITIYKSGRPNATAVIVCPGGGYNILAIEHEGTQVCEWLNSIGVTAVLLKYRVPSRQDQGATEAPLQDAQRALGMVRYRAQEWDINPERIGILGFSAGGHLSVMMALHANERTYERDPRVEAEDAAPDFAIPVYPAFLVDRDDTFRLKPEYVVTEKAPPICLIHAHNDKGLTSPTGSALLYLEYKKLNLPAELHIYTKGGHGFGMKRNGVPADDWHVRAAEWMRSMGWVDAP